ncbi:3-phosphoshikimate 1-carboxyvinyltransferase [Tessaracoccus antarcticus]|uniref:3-phosphoshikimate 1-carboxyvinyltransferase n=1 Tax=Tessaracoccus antarcticus TaxID=2479848 RepID=A0A3M0G255_9ACTN|nr:3-phosphoshikimate 1-carboxyvinyltransferase [Tessaracoccus antarcticus]RMB58865.1 3-phosphoshikimate 1-carboxyvinyltransferase [Tessaracoccus antarcticus]
MAHLLPSSPGPVTAEVLVPGSKSETNRAFVIAALADGPCTVKGALASRDSDLMIAALRSMGVTVEGDVSDGLRITAPQRFTTAASGIDCGLAGTVMRFVPPVALLAGGPTHFYGDPHASNRPMAGLLDALRQLGADVDSDRLPFTVTPGRSASNVVRVDSSATSQYISGLLLVAARLPRGLRIEQVGATVPSRPHIGMTVHMLRQHDVHIDEVDDNTWQVAPGPIAARDMTVEPDLTNASVFLAAAAVTGGSVTVPSWPAVNQQAGGLFLDIARRLGATVDQDGDRVTLHGPERLQGIDVDLHASSELTPVVASLGALARGTTRIRGVGHIRGHETDRLAALVTEFTRLGITAHETDDGLVVEGVDSPTDLAPTEFETYADHRMVHSAAILALRVPGLSVTDLACVAKTMPNFEADWLAAVGA